MATTKAYALGRLGNKLSVNGTDVDIGGKIKTEISAPAITIDASDAGGKTPIGEELFPNGGLENAIANGWSKSSEVSFISNKHGDNTVANILSTDGTFAYIHKVVTLTAGKRYLMQYNLVRYKSGTPHISVTSPTFYTNTSPDHTTTLGTKSYSFTATASGNHILRVTRNGGTCDFDVDNISLKEVAVKNTAVLNMTGGANLSVGDDISSISISKNGDALASINTTIANTNNSIVGDTTIATTGELILDAGTGITIDGNSVTNQYALVVSNVGAGNGGIVMGGNHRIGSLSFGNQMDHARATAVRGVNKSLAFVVDGSYGDANYAAFDFRVDANASNTHPAVMGIRGRDNNALLFQGEQYDSTVVFSVDYDGNVVTSGTVDGVDIAARDVVLTSTTTTANDALPKTGGTITGDVTATTVNATTVDLGNWTVSEESGSLLFATQGVTKMKLDSSGNLDVVGNINSSAYIYSAAALIVNGKTPKLAFDFVNSYYRNSGVDSTFANSINHSRASSATMTNSSGTLVTVGTGVPRTGHHVYNGSAWVNEGLLHESEARTNLFLQSNQLDTTWIVGGSSVTAAAGTSPSGLSDAWRWTNTASSPLLYQSSSYVVGEYTVSAWVKSNGAGKDEFRLYGQNTETSSNFTATSEWVRYSYTFTTTVGGSAFGGLAHATGSNVVDVLVYGLQLEVGATASSYIPTSASTATRAADILTISAAKVPSVATAPFAEVSGTEILTNSGFDTDTNWTKGTGWSIANGVLTKAPSTASGSTYQEGTFTVTPDKMYKVEVDVTVGQSSGGAIIAQFWGGGGGETDPNHTSTSYGVGYQDTQSAGTYTWYIVPTINRIRAGIISAGGWNGTITSISLKEINPPTISIQMSGTMTYADEDLFGSTNHDGAGQATFYRRTAGPIDYMFGGIQTGTVRTGQFITRQRITGAAGASMVQGSEAEYSPGINVPFKIATRHGATFINGAVEGTALTADITPTALPDLSSTNLELGYDYMGTISKFVMWDEDIGDAGIASASL